MAAAPPPTTIPQLSKLDLVIETPRLRLRPFAPTDVDDLWPIVSNPEFPKQMSWVAHVDREETFGFVEAANRKIAENNGVIWAIEHDKHVIGCIGFDSMTFLMRALRVDRGELGYWLAPAFWNKGFMTEAAAAVLRCGFRTIGLHKIMVGCLAGNVSSRRVIEKLGFRYVGRLEDDVWRDGKWHAHLRYEMTGSEWSDVAAAS